MRRRGKLNVKYLFLDLMIAFLRIAVQERIISDLRHALNQLHAENVYLVTPNLSITFDISIISISTGWPESATSLAVGAEN